MTPEKTLENLSLTNIELEKTVKLYKELNNQTLAQSEILIPLMRMYQKELIDVRMAIGREVIEIMRSAKQLDEIQKITPNLVSLVGTINKLSESLTPEMMDLLDRIVNGGIDK